MEQESDKRKAIRETSIEALLAAQRFRDLAPGEFVSYGELRGLIGMHPQSEVGRRRVKTARKIVEREGIAIDVVRGEGLKRLTDEGIASTGVGATKRLARMAHKAKRVLLCLGDYNSLTSEGKLAYNTSLSQVAALEIVSSPVARRKIKRQIADSGQALPTRKVLDLFQDGADGE